MRPNMRVQRTRSSASPPRWPLTRKPLGGRIALALLTALSAACASSNDTATARCSLQPSQDGMAELQVVVLGGSADRAEVAVLRDDERAGTRFVLPLSRPVLAPGAIAGLATDSTPLPLGPWVVAVTLPSGSQIRKKFELVPNSLCVVQVVLRAHA